MESAKPNDDNNGLDKVKKEKFKQVKSSSSEAKESWWSGYARATKEEFQSRIGSSFKRVVKFCGLAIIPILYAIICIVAFWNPIPNIGEANVTFIDKEQEVLVMTNQELQIPNADKAIVWTADNDPNFKPAKTANPVPFMTTILEKTADGSDDSIYNEVHYKDKADFARVIGWMDTISQQETTSKLEKDDHTQPFATSANKNFKTANDETIYRLNETNVTKFMMIVPTDGSIGNLVNYNTDYNYVSNAKYVYYLSAFQLLLASGILHTDGTSQNLEDNTYYTDELTEGIKLTNIHYRKWDNGGDNLWHSYKSYIQIKINQNYARSIIDFINYNTEMLSYVSSALDITSGTTDETIKMDLTKIALFTNGDGISPVAGQDIGAMIKANSWNKDGGMYANNADRVSNTQLEIWTTFARNFLFGYYVNTINSFKEAIPAQMIDKLLQNNDIIGSILAGNDKASLIASLLANTGIQNLPNVKKNINIEIEGVQNGIYGIGLGEFFLMIGLYVGTLLHTFVYDRAKRGGPKTTHSQWYLSKLTLMVATGFVQVTLLTLIAAAVGWHQLGVTRMAELWGVLLLTDLTFKVTIQALWFSIKDETIGKFLVVLYMILNLSSGWGTFPSFMQFGFFHAMSYVTEYTYGLHMFGVAVYGGNYSSDTAYMMQNFGIMLAFIAVFFTFGFFMSILRNREMHFGTHYKKHVLEGLNALGQTEVADSLRQHGWKTLYHTIVHEDLIAWMRVNHPYEGQFKWYKKGNRPRPIKPNYSDDDIMTRNDDTLV